MSGSINGLDLASLKTQYPLDGLTNFAQTDEIIKANQLIPADDFSQDADIREIFIEEAEENLEHLAIHLPLWKKTPNDLASLSEVRRSFHTLKGSGRMVGAHVAGEVAGSIENLLNRVISGNIDSSTEVINLVEKTVAIFPIFIKDFENVQPTQVAPVVTIVQANNLLAQQPLNKGLPAVSHTVDSPVRVTEVEPAITEDAIENVVLENETLENAVDTMNADNQTATNLTNETNLINEKNLANETDLVSKTDLAVNQTETKKQIPWLMMAVILLLIFGVIFLICSG